MHTNLKNNNFYVFLCLHKGWMLKFVQKNTSFFVLNRGNQKETAGLAGAKSRHQGFWSLHLVSHGATASLPPETSKNVFYKILASFLSFNSFKKYECSSNWIISIREKKRWNHHLVDDHFLQDSSVSVSFFERWCLKNKPNRGEMFIISIHQELLENLPQNLSPLLNASPTCFLFYTASQLGAMWLARTGLIYFSHSGILQGYINQSICSENDRRKVEFPTWNSDRLSIPGMP